MVVELTTQSVDMTLNSVTLGLAPSAVSFSIAAVVRSEVSKADEGKIPLDQESSQAVPIEQLCD